MTPLRQQLRDALSRIRELENRNHELSCQYGDLADAASDVRLSILRTEDPAPALAYLVDVINRLEPREPGQEAA
jgi:hypothetical protein